jgi:cytochrome c biogenesis protein CcdA
MLASVNPCGFIMLPAFAAFYISSGGVDDSPTTVRRLCRAIEMGALVTLAFVVTFGIAGAVIGAGGYFVTRWITGAGIALGTGLILLGVYQFVTRRSIFANISAGLRIQRSASLGGVLMFGIAYAIASLSCTLSVFLTVVGSIFAGTGSYLDSVASFIQYAAGMGLVLTVVTLGIAVFRELTMHGIGKVLPYVEAFGNFLLVFAGGYLVWYWTAYG